MYVELTTGKDSFRAQGQSKKRNVNVNTLVRVNDDGEGRQIVPVFAAFQKKLKSFRETSMINTIPATQNHGPEVAGSWYVNRHELKPGTEIMIEYKHRDPNQTFSESTEYLLLRANEQAPLYRCRLELPYHHLSAVPFIFFIGRFEIIKDDEEQLENDAINAWADWLGLDTEEFQVSDVLDPNMELPLFVFEELEPAPKTRNKVRKEIVGGTTVARIKRTRKIKTRR